MSLKSGSGNNRIVVFCPYYPPHVGGLESHAQEWNAHMAKRGYEITVFTPRLPAEAPEQEIEDGEVTVYRFPALELIPNFPVPKWWSAGYWRQRRNALRERPGIVISRTRFFLTSLMAMWYAKTRRIPWMHVEHGSDYVHLDNLLFRTCARVYDYTFGRLVLVCANRVVANSGASAAFVRQLAFGRKSVVIYRGIDQERIERARPDELLRQTYGDRIVLFVGRLIDGKGVPDLIRAIKEVPEASACLIVGDGPQRGELERLVGSLGLREKIMFLGRKGPDELYRIMKSANVMVNPSYTEGIPTAVIEAAFCRLPIVATDVGGTSEIIEHEKSGLLVSPRDFGMLGEAVQGLIDNPDRAEVFTEAVYHHVSSLFIWERAMKRYTNLLHSMS